MVSVRERYIWGRKSSSSWVGTLESNEQNLPTISRGIISTDKSGSWIKGAILQGIGIIPYMYPIRPQLERSSQSLERELRCPLIVMAFRIRFTGRRCPIFQIRSLLNPWNWIQSHSSLHYLKSFQKHNKIILGTRLGLQRGSIHLPCIATPPILWQIHRWLVPSCKWLLSAVPILVVGSNVIPAALSFRRNCLINTSFE